MTLLPQALLTDRGVVAVRGPDAEKLLQGLVTNDVAHLVPGQGAAFAGLLSPQGKILFDFIVHRTADGFLLDVDRGNASALAKRLTLYRLRSKVEIADRSEDVAVLVAWAPDGGQAFAEADPRLQQLGARRVQAASETPVRSGNSASERAYHAHRIALGVPEGGRDYVYGGTFPHEALYDQLHGVSFDKGCYVGQEIVSRMQHRGTARKRIVMVSGDAPLPAPGTAVTAGGVDIGALGSAMDRDGLALIRLDRAAEFKAKGVPIAAGEVALRLAVPPYARFPLFPEQTLPT